MKYKIGITGPKGRLGSTLVAMGGIPITSDILKLDSLKKEIGEIRPDILIHTAAYTKVDLAEEEPDVAMRVNARGTANVRDAFLGQMILISTDYVFDGRAGPYRENDIPNPLNWYGQSKLASEAMVDPHKDIIIRTTNLYGNWDKPDFVQTILEKYKQGKDFFVTDKLEGNPTYIPHLAEALIFVANQMCQGISLPSVLNVAGEPRLSRYHCAQRLGFIFSQDVTLCQPSPSGLVEDKAVRPKRAGLILERAKRLGVPIYSFETGLFAMKEDVRNVNYK